MRDVNVRCTCREIGLVNKIGFESTLASIYGSRWEDDDLLWSQLHGAYWHCMMEAALRPLPSTQAVDAVQAFRTSKTSGQIQRVAKMMCNEDATDYQFYFCEGIKIMQYGFNSNKKYLRDLVKWQVES